MGKKEKSCKGDNKEKAQEKQEKKQLSTGKKILKIAAWSFGSLFAFLLLLVIFRDPVIKFSVTSIGSWVTGVDIVMEDFDTSLFKGTATVTGLKVGNPAGFDEPNMLELEKFHADIDLGSLLTKEIVIEDIQVANLNVNAEFNRQSKFNVTTLTGNLKRRFPPETDDDDDDNDDPVPENDAPETEKPAILFKNINVSIKLSLIHDLSHANLGLPISYSETDLRIAPDDEETPLVIKLDELATRFEEFCQTCFNAGALVISAGAEAGETLKSGVDSGINAGKKVFDGGVDAGKKVFDGGVDAGKKVMDGGKNIFKSATSIFK